MVVKRSPIRNRHRIQCCFCRGKSTTMLGSGNSDGNGLKLSQKAAYGLGHIMNDISSAMWFSYTLLFFEKVLKMPGFIAGFLVFLGQVGDAIVSPIIGMVIRYGSLTTWYLLGTIVVAFSYPPIFEKCPWLPDFVTANSTNETHIQTLILNSWDLYDTTQTTLGIIYYSFLIVVFQTGWATIQISHLAMIPQLSMDKVERAKLASIRFTANFIAYTFVFLITWLILHVTEDNKSTIGPEDLYKFRAVVILGQFCGAICSLIFYWVIKKPESHSDVTNECSKDVQSWCSVVKEYFKSFTFYQVTLTYLCSRMIVTFTLVYMPLYLVEQVGKEAEFIATIPLICYISSFVASLWVGQVRNYWSNKMNYFIGTVIAILGSVWVKCNFKYTGELFGIAVLLGAGGSITGVASLSLCADLIGTDTKNGAFVYSVVTCVDKLLGGVAVIVVETLKYELFAENINYYQDVIIYGNGVSSIVGLFALITMYLTRKKKCLSEEIKN